MAKLLDGITGHPKALYMLFFTEMWERFTFMVCAHCSYCS